MQSKSQIKKRIREVEVAKAFEEGRHSLLMEQAKDVDATKAAAQSIREKDIVIATLKGVLQ